jgi:hypothetical protein
VTIDGVWINDSIYWSLTQLVIPLNYSAIANFYTLNKQLAHTLSLFQPAVSSLVVAW